MEGYYSGKTLGVRSGSVQRPYLGGSLFQDSYNQLVLHLYDVSFQHDVFGLADHTAYLIEYFRSDGPERQLVDKIVTHLAPWSTFEPREPLATARCIVLASAVIYSSAATR